MKLFKRKAQDIPGRRRRSFETERASREQDDRSQLFARNRTLTGSTSNHLSDNRLADLQSPRSHAHHLAVRRRRIGSIFLVVVAIAAVLLFLLMQLTSRITVSVSDTSLSKSFDEPRYVKAINDYLAANPLSRFRFVFDPDALSHYLESVVPEVMNVSSIAMGSIGETHVTLSMRHPVAGWTINNTQYFVDESGIAFQVNYFGSPNVQIVDNSGVALEQGTAVASNRFLGFVGRVVSQSKSRGYTVTQAIIPVNTTRQLEIVIQETPTHVKLSVDRAVGEQIEDMARALTYLKSRGSTPSYIDVRVSGKAFYK